MLFKSLLTIFAIFSSSLLAHSSPASSPESTVLKFDVVAYQTNSITAWNKPESVVGRLSKKDDWSNYNPHENFGIHVISAISIDNVPLKTSIKTSTLSDINSIENNESGQYKYDGMALSITSSLIKGKVTIDYDFKISDILNMSYLNTVSVSGFSTLTVKKPLLIVDLHDNGISTYVIIRVRMN